MQLVIKFVPLLLITVLLVFCAWILSNYLPTYDLAQYWGAGQLFVANQNPYDYLQLKTIQQTLSFNTLIPFTAVDLPVVMYNPPTVIPLIGWMGFFSFIISMVILFMNLSQFIKQYKKNKKPPKRCMFFVNS